MALLLGTTTKSYDVMTGMEYDLSQLQALFNKVVLSIVVAITLYFVKEYTTPLVLQSIGIPLTITGSEVFRIHLQVNSITFLSDATSYVFELWLIFCECL